MGKRLCLCLLEPGVRRKHHTCETFCFFPPQSEYLKKTKQTKKKTLPFGSEGCKRFCIFEAEAELFSLPLFEKKTHVVLVMMVLNKRVSYILGENLNQGNGLNAGVSGTEC